jgi:hypothetical protein
MSGMGLSHKGLDSDLIIVYTASTLIVVSTHREEAVVAEREGNRKKSEAIKPWRLSVPVTRAWQRPIRSWSLLEGVEMDEIVSQALEMWAAKQGIKLPPRTPREPVSSQEPDQRTWGMNSAF